MALPEKLVNATVPGTRAAFTTLSAELSEAGVEAKWTLAPPVALHGAGQFRVLIGSEIMVCEGGESTTVKILERGAEGSTKAIHAINAEVWIVETKGMLEAALKPRIKVDVFTVNAEKWKKPEGALTVRVICIGQGAGGGGGAHGKSGTVCTGGGGGAGGGMTSITVAPSTLAAEVTITVNSAVATGGAGFEAEKAGQGGSNGNPSKFGTLCQAEAGAGGKGGEITGVAAKGGGELQASMFIGNKGGECAATGKPTPGQWESGQGGFAGCGGGGGGGGITATPTAEAGALGGISPWTLAAGGAGGAATGEAGKNGSEPGKEEGIPGGGGGGGGASTAVAGGVGGKGGLYGGGGGGGGAAITASKFSGAGGEGGKGAVIVITTFSSTKE